VSEHDFIRAVYRFIFNSSRPRMLSFGSYWGCGLAIVLGPLLRLQPYVCRRDSRIGRWRCTPHPQPFSIWRITPRQTI